MADEQQPAAAQSNNNAAPEAKESTTQGPKIGCTPETLRVWHQKYLDQQNPVKVQQLSDQERIKQLERENKELQRANEILRKAAAFFAQAELDRPHK